jgi:hypothetical protein
MNELLWIAQILLASIFLFTGVSKLLAYERVIGAVEARSKGVPAGVSRGLAACIGGTGAHYGGGRHLPPAPPGFSRARCFAVPAGSFHHRGPVAAVRVLRCCSIHLAGTLSGISSDPARPAFRSCTAMRRNASPCGRSIARRAGMPAVKACAYCSGRRFR